MKTTLPNLKSVLSRDDGYESLAKARGQEVVFFEMLGSYQGEFILISKDDEKYYLWKDWYGSCSGCDSWESLVDYNWEKVNEKELENFIEGYRPFIEIPIEKMEKMSLVEIKEILPFNMRFGYGEGTDEDYLKLSKRILDTLIEKK